jgi:hypothetical protein
MHFYSSLPLHALLFPRYSSLLNSLDILMGEVSVKIDSFAMGVVLLEELTGRPPADTTTGVGLDVGSGVDVGSAETEAVLQPLYILLEDVLDDHKLHNQDRADDCDCGYSLGQDAVNVLDPEASWPHRTAHKVR